MNNLTASLQISYAHAIQTLNKLQTIDNMPKKALEIIEKFLFDFRDNQ